MIAFVIPWCGPLATVYFHSGFIVTTESDGAGLGMEFEVVH